MDESGRRIGFLGAVGTLVGYVIGASIFVLPAELMADTGPGIALSYLLAAVPAALSCLVGAVVGNAIPEDGACYLATRRAISPFAGFLTAYSLLVAVVFGFALVAYGFADYLRYFAPQAPPRWIAIGVVALFGLLNLARVRTTVAVQGAMVLGFTAVLFTFCAGGLARGDYGLLSPLFPKGAGAVLSASVPAYFSYAGFIAVIEIGGEIRDPMRNIPRTLLASFALTALLYVLVTLALALTLPSTGGAHSEAAMGRAAARILPSWFAAALVAGALLAAATSINGMLLAHARDVQVLARDRLLPEALAGTSARGVPAAAVTALTTVAIGAILLGGTLREYAVATVLGVMVLQFALGLAAFRIPEKLPEELSCSRFRLPPRLHRLTSAALMTVSLAFFVVGAADSLRATAVFAALLAAGILYYAFRAPRALPSGGGLR